MSETQEWLNELWSSDPALYEYLTSYEDEEPSMLDALEERMYLKGELDEVPISSLMS